MVQGLVNSISVVKITKTQCRVTKHNDGVPRKVSVNNCGLALNKIS